MLIDMTQQEAEALVARLDAFEDAEMIGDREYVIDLYDGDEPMSMQVLFTPKGPDVLAAEQLAYDEELKGYYLSGPIEDREKLRAAFDRVP